MPHQEDDKFHVLFEWYWMKVESLIYWEWFFSVQIKNFMYISLSRCKVFNLTLNMLLTFLNYFFKGWLCYKTIPLMYHYLIYLEKNWCYKKFCVSGECANFSKYAMSSQTLHNRSYTYFTLKCLLRILGSIKMVWN